MQAVTLTGLATPAEFTSAEVSLYPDSYTLAWTAESGAEVSRFRVMYKVGR